ncbi:MAG: uroporphyrinogen-III synthase, partial [Bacillota bacterium]
TLLEWLANGEIDIITFTSSSTVQNFIKILEKENIPLLKQAKVACIGPVTADTAKKLGLKVEIEAKEFTIDGLVQAIVES